MVCLHEQGESRRERHMAFIQANRDQLAEAARDGYREYGRGMLLMEDGDFVDKPRGVLTRYRRVYIAEGMSEFAGLGSKWMGDREARWVAEYDPETTMWMAFARTGGGVSSYRVRFKVQGRACNQTR